MESSRWDRHRRSVDRSSTEAPRRSDGSTGHGLRTSALPASSTSRARRDVNPATPHRSMSTSAPGFGCGFPEWLARCALTARTVSATAPARSPSGGSTSTIYNGQVERYFIMKKLSVLAASAIVIVLAATHVRSAGPTAVVVSLQRIATQSNAGKRANQQLEALRQERGRDLQAKQKELEEVVRQLAKDSLPQADRERLSQDESRRRTEFQQLTAQAQTDFQAMQARLNTEIRSHLAPIFADIAKRAGVDVVLNSDTIAWSAAGTDMTDEVVQRLNAAP